MNGENGRNDMSAGPSSGSASQSDVLRGIILDEQSVLTLTELSHVCAVQTGYIIELVDEGLVTPDIATEENEPQHWRFSGAQYAAQGPPCACKAISASTSPAPPSPCSSSTR